jgi:hypothetical protein
MSVFLLTSAAFAEKKTVTLDGKFGEVKQEHTLTPDEAMGVKLGQKVRVDQLSSNDPDFNGSTITLYEHGVNFPTFGTYTVYGVVATPKGDKAFLRYEGKWNGVTKDGQFVEAPFLANGELTGGTGKFERITGTVRQSGKVTPATSGVYRIEIDATY